ncbi:conserved hypothetical protein [Vibrio jasicida]|uniref:hypothetical protein n=1 Tax=Vibrio jasicida TaxID=766224 RepID=UPI002895C855|nr:conserved hypothetical protein [Vibrio jasicida]CAH1606565.1 conserved hypothetical protein [Vibrio jasicida]
MKLKRYLSCFCVAGIISFGTQAETHIFRLVSEIDKSQFFSHQITDVAFSPSSLTLKTNTEKNTFNDAFTLLTVTTDIPSSDQSMKFQLFMKSNTSQCYSADETALVTPSDFAQVYIEGQPLTEIEPLLMEFNQASDGVKVGEYDVKFSFGTLPESASLCQGELSVLAELSL